MIYTSYFSKIKDLPDNFIPISICCKVPYYYTGLQYKKLAPSYDLLMDWKKNNDINYYIKHFKEQTLDKLNTRSVIIDLINLSNFEKGKVLCLLCYEKPTDFCHRHLVAEWFNQNGIKCEEYKF